MCSRLRRSVSLLNILFYYLIFAVGLLKVSFVIVRVKIKRVNKEEITMEPP